MSFKYVKKIVLSVSAIVIYFHVITSLVDLFSMDVVSEAAMSATFSTSR